jgi:hypothetical protein
VERPVSLLVATLDLAVPFAGGTDPCDSEIPLAAPSAARAFAAWRSSVSASASREAMATASS